jgi:integrase
MAVRKRKDRGFWEYDFIAGGRRYRVGGFAKKQEAADAEAEERTRIARQDGGLVAKGALSVADYLDQWLAVYAPSRVKPSTAQRYEELIRLHIKPAVGAEQLKKLRPLDIERCYQAVLAKGLSLATAQRVHALLHLALSQAVRWQLIFRSPVEAVDPPRPSKVETRTPTVEELAVLLTAADKTQLGAYFRFAALTGMRRGEILALRWQDVDFERQTVMVRGSVRRLGKGRGMVRLTPKRQSSIRKLTLPAPAMEILTQQRWRQLRDASKLGQDYEDAGIVFANHLGGYRDPDHVTRVWGKVAESVGLAEIRLHDLRHALATRLLELGVHAKVVQEILGHSSYTTTMNIYSHVTQGLQTEAMAQLGQLLGGLGGTDLTKQPD